MTTKLPATLILSLFLTGFSYAVDAPASAVQVDISKLLNIRFVTTLVDGKVKPHNVPDNTGYITKSAAAALGVTDPHTLPDDGKFEANADHPEVILNYSTGGSQIHNSPAGKEEEYSFAVPPNHYEKMFLILTSQKGGAPLDFTLTYQDGSTESRTELLSAWWSDPVWWVGRVPNDHDLYFIGHELSKFDNRGKLQESGHHFINALDIHPSPAKVLVEVKVHKAAPAQIFLWGVTGQVKN